MKLYRPSSVNKLTDLLGEDHDIHVFSEDIISSGYELDSHSLNTLINRVNHLQKENLRELENHLELFFKESPLNFHNNLAQFFKQQL